MQPILHDANRRLVDDPAPLYRKLRSGDGERFAAHLLRLDPDDRRMRFCSPVNDAAVRGYCEQIDWWRTTALGCFVGGVLRGAAELVPMRGEPASRAELAVTVERPFQDRGIGSELLRRALTLARNRYISTVVMVCLAENRKMRHIARKFDAELDFSGGEIEGRLWPSYPTMLSLMEEAAMDGRAIFHARFETKP